MGGSCEKMLRLMAIFVMLLALGTSVLGQSIRSTVVFTEGLNNFIGALKAYEFKPPSSPANLREVQNLVRLGRSAIGPQDSIVAFNSVSDISMIRKLVDISTVDISDIRINAALILTDVVENRTVCTVVNKLMESELSDNARFNLLQVLKIISSSNRLKNVEVKSWIGAAVQRNRALMEHAANADKTKSLLSEIERNVNSKVVSDRLAADYPRSYMECLELSNIKALTPAQ